MAVVVLRMAVLGMVVVLGMGMVGLVAVLVVVVVVTGWEQAQGCRGVWRGMSRSSGILGTFHFLPFHTVFDVSLHHLFGLSIAGVTMYALETVALLRDDA
jgi:hypothetical protein